MKHRLILLPAPAILALLVLFGAAGAHADNLYTVTMDTSGLISAASAPYYLDFQLNQGTPGNNNTLTLSNFAFGAGGSVPAGATTYRSGSGVTGDLLTSVVLNDSVDFYNEFYEEFTAGSLLSFAIDFTTNNTAAQTPDLITFAILDHTLSELPTLDPGLTNTFLSITLDSDSPAVLTFASDSSIAPQAGGSALSLPAPVAEPSGPLNAVPEPSSLCLLATLLLLLPASRRLHH